MPKKTPRKTDRRTLYTRQAIKDALLSLKSTVSYNSITVSALCREAQISRGTFYLHYSNIAEVLDSIMEDILSEIRDLFSQISSPEALENRCKTPFCIYIRENKKYHCLFLDDTLTSYIIEKTIGAARNFLKEELQKTYSFNHLQLETLLYFQFSGCFSVVKRNIRMEQEDWCEIQNCIDHFIKNGFREIRNCR